MSVCPSLVMFILIIQSGIALFSPMYDYYDSPPSFLTNKKTMQISFPCQNYSLDLASIEDSCLIQFLSQRLQDDDFYNPVCPKYPPTCPLLSTVSESLPFPFTYLSICYQQRIMTPYFVQWFKIYYYAYVVFSCPRSGQWYSLHASQVSL